MDRLVNLGDGYQINEAIKSLEEKINNNDFTEDEMMEIYTYIGNACNHQRTIKFVESGYDLKVLKE